jgi:4-alpha-glucanotransferase
MFAGDGRTRHPRHTRINLNGTTGMMDTGSRDRAPADASGSAFVRDALRRLGVRRFALGVHASAFPPGRWDAGFGAPLSEAGRRLLAFAARLGFNAVQLGPVGQVSPRNLSPYDGTAFARNTWSLDLAALATEEFANLLPRSVLEELHLDQDDSQRVQPARVERIMHRVLDACCARVALLRAERPGHFFLRDFERFRVEQRQWLEPNAFYDTAAARFGDDPDRFDPSVQALFEPGTPGVQRRAGARAEWAPMLERSELAQYLCHVQHAAFRTLARVNGLELWGDLQAGFSRRDYFLHRDCFAPRRSIGAPPSRTNPLGQPWGYPLLDPDQLDSADSPARQLFAARLGKLLSEHDGLRIDHPHGLVCPWIYRADDPDPSGAVRRGTRAFSSPDSSDPQLARWAIARRGDLNPAPRSRFGDDWVRQLDDAQISRYSRLFDVLIGLCGGRSIPDVLAAEVLSTCPYPLEQVLARHGLGRFRVTQKSDWNDPTDVYRTDQARVEDWVMLGTHDTPPIFPLAVEWVRDGGAVPRAMYLAERLILDAAEHPRAAAQFASSVRDLLCASLADLFLGPAKSVYVFVGDLFGSSEPFNRAGVVHPDNWTARLPENFEAVYAERLRAGHALDIVGALRLALTRRLHDPGP